MRFPETLVKVEAAFGADLTADPSSWTWTDLSDRLHQPAGVRISYGLRDGARQSESLSIGFTLTNDDGKLTYDDPRGEYWPYVDEGLPMRVTLDPGLDPVETLEFGAFVTLLRQRSTDPSDTQFVVDVELGGPLRAGGRGRGAARSALWRYIVSEAPAAFWSATDGADATQGQPAVGSAVLRPRADWGTVRWAAGRLAPWLEPSLVLVDGQMLGDVSCPATTTWSADVLFRSTGAGGKIGLSVASAAGRTTTEGRLAWVLLISAPDNAAAVAAADENTGVIETDVIGLPAVFDGKMHHARLTVAQNGGQSDWTVHIDGAVFATGNIGSLGVLAPGRVSLSNDVEDGGTDLVVGYLTAWGSSAPTAADVWAAANGRTGAGAAGERAADRVERVCQDAGVKVTILGDPDTSELMGPQRPGGYKDVARDCETAEDGVLTEANFGVVFRTRGDLYNQTAALTLDYAAREIHPPFGPVRDDQRLRNSWTARRTDGGEVTATDPDDIAARGERTDSTEVNVVSGDRLTAHASWRLQRALDRSPRVPQLTVAMHSASDEQLAAVMAARVGDRLGVVNLPDRYGPADLDQIIERIEHRITSRSEWFWQATCASYAPWIVGVTADGAPGPADPVRVDTCGTTTVGDFDAGTDTALTVLSTDRAGWTTDSGDLPLDIRVAGVRLRVTAIAPGGSPGEYDMTVTATPINGITKTIPGGMPVSLWQPARIAL